jgi:hypothetical protein
VKTPETTPIYNVYRNSDLNEGRGVELCIGSFEDEDEAWAFADTQRGVMGYKPTGSWRAEQFPDVKVKRQDVVKKHAKYVHEFHYIIRTEPTHISEFQILKSLNQWLANLHQTAAPFKFYIEEKTPK